MRPLFVVPMFLTPNNFPPSFPIFSSYNGFRFQFFLSNIDSVDLFADLLLPPVAVARTDDNEDLSMSPELSKNCCMNIKPMIKFSWFSTYMSNCVSGV